MGGKPELVGAGAPKGQIGSICRSALTSLFPEMERCLALSECSVYYNVEQPFRHAVGMSPLVLYIYHPIFPRGVPVGLGTYK
jgi:hypothetical protein